MDIVSSNLTLPEPYTNIGTFQNSLCELNNCQAPTLIITCPLTIIHLLLSGNIKLFNHSSAIVVVVIGRSIHRISNVAASKCHFALM